MEKLGEKVGADYVQYDTIEKTLFRVDSCEDFPDLWFAFDGNWLQVAQESYTIMGGLFCELDIVKIDKPYNIMGLPLLAGYYTTFDDQNSRILVSLLKDSPNNNFRRY